MPRVVIDGRPFDVAAGQDMLSACLSLKLDLPYFCWHPALGSVGACRQCAVKQYRDEEDREGKLVMACMTPAGDGTRISTVDPEARRFRAEVIEWLMLNHPHDCPVCDEGGECHLQDMTVMTGHVYRRFRFRKRTYRNQDLGPLVNHEMNRCIQCYRCVRFYRDFAGGPDLHDFGSHGRVYFGRMEDGTLQSPFAGNLVEVCPTGVFTDKTLKRHYTRKWDLQTAPSVCVHCAIGCNTTPGERYGELRRVRARYHAEVNGYFLCDRGRYGYEFANDEQRVRRPLAPQGLDAPAEALDAAEARARAAEWLRDPERVVGIGSPRASLEDNFALRALVGPQRFHAGVEAVQHELAQRVLELLRDGAARTPPLREVERADAVLVLGEDATGTAPMLGLALRQAARQQPLRLADERGIPRWNDAAVRDLLQARTGPLFLAVPHATELDDVARRTLRAEPEVLARLGFAVAHELDEGAPAVPDLGDAVRERAAEIAQALASADRPLLVSGTSLGCGALLDAAANVAAALARRRGRPADLFCVLPECNSLGLQMLRPRPLEEAFAAVESGRADTVVILENDLYRRAPRARVDRLLEGARHVIVIDCLAHDTAARAGLMLPSGAFAESDGTLVNQEGRAQRRFQVYVPEGDVQEGWRWLRDAGLAAGRGELRGWQQQDDVGAALAEAEEVFRGRLPVPPRADTRLAGTRVPRKPHRYSGRTAQYAAQSVFEPQPPGDPDSPLAYTMEGYEARPPGPLVPEFWAPGWNSIQALSKFQAEVDGPLEGGDPGVRLLDGPDAARAREVPYADRVPPAPERRPGRWRAVPIHHVFGSEELSAIAPGVAALAPEPYVGVCPEDAAELGAAPGEPLAVRVNGETLQLPVRILPGLARGLAGLPAGLRPLPLAGRLAGGATATLERV